MFSYFGSKAKIVHLYPKPMHDHIIEPFAGSARYACRYGIERDVTLVDKYDVIVRVWKWIINATPSDIRALPELKTGEKVSDCKGLSQAERDLLGFCTSKGTQRPGNKATRRACGYHSLHSKRTPLVPLLKEALLKLTGRISHWKIIEGSYEELENTRATWYVDPPYQIQGKCYVHNQIDYSHLASWCREREGQVIVCEGSGADWLPFRFLDRNRGDACQRKSSKCQEMIWYKTDKKPGFGF